MSIGKVVRGGFWLSLGLILSSFFGFIYWLVVSRLVGPEVVGKAAAVLGVESLTLALLGFGVPIGVQRFVGRSYGRRDFESLGEYFYSSLFLLLLLSILGGASFLLMAVVGVRFLFLDRMSLIFVGILMMLGMNGWPAVSYALFRSLLKTEYVAATQVISGIIRLSIGILLVYLGLSFTGIMLGYVTAAATTSILMLLLPLRILKAMSCKFLISLRSVGEVLKAGVVSWIPNIMVFAGQWIGVLGLHAWIGGFETGTYFIAFAITSALMSLSQMILNLMFPVLSGMYDGRKRTMYRAVIFSASIMSPLAFTLIAYPSLIPSLLSPSYAAASTPIQILAAGYLLTPAYLGYTYYAYALGKYREVMAIGLAENIPRLVLYAILTGVMGERGVAVGYSTGMIFALITAIFLAKKARFKLGGPKLLKIAIIPLIISLLIIAFGISWMIGIPSLLIVSYILYTRLGMITKQDLKEIAEAFLSKRTLEKVYPHVRSVLWILYGE